MSLNTLKKLINRFLKETQIEEKEKLLRLIINHTIIVYNVFEIEAANRMLEFKMNKEHIEVLKPILLFLNYINERNFIDSGLNKETVDYCRKLKQ